MVAAGEVRPADGATEQDVADESDLGALVEQDHMAGRVAGAMADAQLDLAHGDRVPILQPAVGQAVLGFREAGPAGIFSKGFKEEEVVPVRAFDLYPEFTGQPGGT